MGDDPRREVMMRRLADGQGDAQHWETYGEIADRYLAAVDAVDPLRAQPPFGSMRRSC
jgi:UDP-N-acetylmuramyl tripeptide synthase